MPYTETQNLRVVLCATEGYLSNRSIKRKRQGDKV